MAPSPTSTGGPPTATASTAQTAGPTAGASGVIAADEISGSLGELPAGRYTRRGFEPRITLELDGPWHSVKVFSGFFDAEQGVGSPDVIAVQFAKPTGIYAAQDQQGRVAGAAAARDALAHNARLKTVESSASRIGGLDGFQVTVENPAAATGDAHILEVPVGAVSISPGRRLRVVFFDTPVGLLAIMVGGSVAKWDAALAAAEPVLESVTIGK